ncbi:hypothetical protein, partial [Yoonia sp.]|uniref:hypothetical protein n=1 Tax=Yoonia sp. TaxID=2212373 RepID=UPI004047666F
GEKRLSGGRIQAFFTSASMPLGECRVLAAFKLTYVRTAIVTLVLIAFPIVLFTSRKYTTFLTVGLTAWVVALYIDDNLVLYRIIEYPDRGLVVFLQTFRPVTIACLIWMSFELTFKNYRK